jgi:superfamily II DNA or RNA helicase
MNIEDFQHSIYDKFKNKKDTKIYKTRKQLCFPKHFEYQLPQKFVSQFINPNTEYKSLLLYHKIGSGKTCAAIQIAEEWKDKRKVFIITPASLKSNMYKEFRSECTGNTYVSDEERLQLNTLSPEENHNLITKINNRINKSVTILSYNKFINKIQNNSINLRNSLLIIDEVHNIISESGTFYNTLLAFIKNAPKSLRIVLLTATPIIDKPYEIGLLMNLLRSKYEFPIGHAFNKMFISSDNSSLQNIELFKKYINGYISYYKGAPNKVFPLKQFKIVNCIMSDYQYQKYSKYKLNFNENDYLLNLNNSFFINSRITSNIVSPTNKTINLQNKSCKIYKLLKKLKYSRGTVFIYSNFLKYGIDYIVKILENNGYLNFNGNSTGTGTKRFALWTGDESSDLKDTILSTFNDISNKDGSKIKILLGSPSIKEGVSLLRVREVHILEPYFNMARIQQVIGRAIRFCSHKDIPQKQRRTVKVFLYIACLPHEIHGLSIDQYILDIAHKKENIISQFEKLLIESSVDKLLYT